MTTKSLEAFQAAASKFGLHLEAGETTWWRGSNLALLEGVVDGTRVLVQQGGPLAGDPCLRVYFHAAIEPELDLGLAISLSRSYLVRSAPLAPTDAPGSVAFDAAFTVRSAEPARARALFTPELSAALVAWHNARRWERDSNEKNSLEFWISDESVILRIATNAFGYGVAHPIGTDELLADIRATAELARTVAAASKHVPPSPQLAPSAAAWRAFASERALAFSESPLRLSGTFDGVAFAARAVVEKEQFGVELTMPFARPLPFYFRLGRRLGWFQIPSGYPDAWAEWVRPHKTGDAAFDHLLRVVSADPKEQNAFLGDRLRGALVDLARAYEHVHMTTTAISLRTSSMIAPDAFGPMLTRLREVERLIDA